MINEPNGFSVIDSDMDVEGNFICNGRLVVRGSVKGAIKAENIVISDQGAVYADIQVNSMVIGGVFEGDIIATGELTILSTGNCSGKVECKNLVIEAGGVINAEVNCTFVKDSVPQKNPRALDKIQNPLKGKLQGYLSSFSQSKTAKSGE